uniref:Uncharacterized protein n=1 Tax=Triticum urartu TaxID=4572 RepID=A0A8R7TLI7_TRIUA
MRVQRLQNWTRCALLHYFRKNWGSCLHQPSSIGRHTTTDAQWACRSHCIFHGLAHVPCGYSQSPWCGRAPCRLLQPQGALGLSPCGMSGEATTTSAPERIEKSARGGDRRLQILSLSSNLGNVDKVDSLD